MTHREKGNLPAAIRWFPRNWWEKAAVCLGKSPPHLGSSLRYTRATILQMIREFAAWLKSGKNVMPAPKLCIQKPETNVKKKCNKSSFSLASLLCIRASHSHSESSFSASQKGALQLRSCKGKEKVRFPLVWLRPDFAPTTPVANASESFLPAPICPLNLADPQSYL